MRNFKTWAGHRAVVTGASSGIGAEYARQLATLGVNLVIAARRMDRLQALALELSSKHGVKVDCCQVDLVAPEGPRVLFDFATADSQQVTVLINNAGLAKYGSFLEFPYEDHFSTLAVNSVAPTEITYRFVKHMLAHRKQSYVTQVASIAAFQPVGNFAVYSGTKGYLMYFSESLAYELRGTSVKIMCLCPGGTYTEFFEHSGQKITSSGRKTMMSSEKVVRLGIQAMLAGKVIFVPGFLNQLACFLPRLIPRHLGQFFAAKAMGRAVEKAS